MNYTDRQMRAFAEIAYMDYKADFESCYKANGNQPVPLTELLYPPQIETLKKLGVTEKEINSWKIAAVHDTNDENGFFACVIETSPNEAAVGFRGSENLVKYKHNKTDWQTNLHLMNSTLNQQQAEVDNFLRAENDILSRYDNLAMTGHSLGGNLAEYATIVSGEYGLDDNIKKCMSLDGPGFSEEFIKKNEKNIKKMSGVMEHVRWSCVGTLLEDLPGVKYRFLQVSNEANTKDHEKMDCLNLNRHATKFLVFDGDSFVDGEQDDLSKVTSQISKGIDHMPSWVGNAFVSVIGNIMLSATWIYDKMVDKHGNITAVGIAVAVEAIIILLLNPEILPIAVEIVVKFVVSVITFVVIAYAYEFVYEKAIELLDALCVELSKISTWFKEKVTEIYNGVVDIINGIKNTYNDLFNPGYRYANNNPNIKVDTDKLGIYAQRISTVNRRLDKLDKRLDKLYKDVGLRDLWYLLQSDLRICYNHKLDKCVMYLYDTAWEFEEVERNINNIV